MDPTVFIYRLFSPFVFRLFSPQTARDKMKYVFKLPIWKISSVYFDRIKDQRLEVKIKGKHFSAGPIGTGGGIDKNMEYPTFHDWTGHDFLEMGTALKYYWLGNPKPRVNRYPQLKSAFNCESFPFYGPDFLEQQMEKYLYMQKPILLNISSRSINKGIDEVINEFVDLIKRFDDIPIIKGYVENLGSPNTDLSMLWDKDVARKLFHSTRKNTDKFLFVKLPYFTKQIFDPIFEIINVSMKEGLDGVISMNTKPMYDSILNAKGGVSGDLITKDCLEGISMIYNEYPKTAIIASGGLREPKYSIEAFRRGANAIELFTPEIFDGPGLPLYQKLEILKYMIKNQYASLEDMRGTFGR